MYGESDDTDRAGALDRDFAAFSGPENRAEPGSGAEYVYDYLLVVARTRT